MTLPMKHDVVATGLKFPEGPIAMPDGSVIVVEIARGTLSRVQPDGTVEVIAETGGGPNGAAIGPDGACYVCNNGGFFWHESGGRLFPGNQPADYSGGRIERIDLATGAVTRLYASCDGHRLCGPNDLVFDAHGGFWFTDHGKTRDRDRDRTGVYYARADGTEIREVIFPMESPNGIGLSPDGSRLYVAETPTGRCWEFAVTGPGEIDPGHGERHGGGRMLPAAPGYLMYDSLAVDGHGRVCVATLIQGGISVIDPAAGSVELRTMPDILTTNICFGGEDLQDAWVTLSTTGQLIRLRWDVPGLRLAW